MLPFMLITTRTLVIVLMTTLWCHTKEAKTNSRSLTYAIPNNVTIVGTLATAKTATIGTGLTVSSGATTLNSNMTMTGRARITGAGNALQITNNASVGGTLRVTGATTMTTTVNAGYLHSAGPLVVSGATALGGPITLNNNMTSTGWARLTGSGTGLAVTHNATIGGTLTIGESLITGSLFVDGVQITGTNGGGVGGGIPEGNITITGNATIKGDLTCTGSTNIAGTLSVNGIAGTTVNVLTYTPVFVDTDSGLLGTVVSSRRYKNDIKDLESHKEDLMQLRPVSFSYKVDPLNITQYGLIAEEVAAVMPELVVYNKEHQPETVAYHILPTLLLNEYQDHEQRLRMVEANTETFAAIVEEIAAIKQAINLIMQKIS